MNEVIERVIPGKYLELQKMQLAIVNMQDSIRRIAFTQAGTGEMTYDSQFLSQFSQTVEVLQALIDDFLKTETGADEAQVGE